MDIDLAQKAISSALSGFWKEAREINKKILRETPKDIDALNRLARAYAELGEITKARSTAEKVLKIDPFNTIAEKSLRKWKGFKKGETQKGSILPAQLFLEEAGRTKIVSLLNIADEKVLAKKWNEEAVKVGHEASVSKIGEDQLFYLQSRGLTRQEAERMIVAGFMEIFAKELPLEYAVELNRLIALEMEGSVG